MPPTHSGTRKEPEKDILIQKELQNRNEKRYLVQYERNRSFGKEENVSPQPFGSRFGEAHQIEKLIFNLLTLE